MKIREIENYGLKILNEKAKDGSMTVYAKFGEAEKRNQNSRIYPLEIMAREVDRVQAKIASGQFLGQADHGDSPATFLKNVSHVVTELEMKGNEGYATIKILNTDAGKNCQEIIRGKGRIGISTRSVGTVDAKTGIIQSDLKLLALDLVSNPSVKDATIGKENILEGLEFEEQQHQEDADTIADREEALFGLLQTSFDKAVADDCWYGSYEEYCKLHENGMRKVLHLPTKNFVSTKAVTEQQIKDRTFSFYQEAVQGGFRGSFDEWKEESPKIVEMANKPIEKIEGKAPKPKEPFKSRATWEEIKLSGWNGTMQEYKECFPNITIIRPAPRQEKIVETLEEEATRVYTGLKKQNPNSAVTLESVKRMLEKEEIVKSDKRLRKRAIAIVSRDLDGSVSQATIEKMVETELASLKKQRQEMRERNWQAYKRLLD